MNGMMMGVGRAEDDGIGDNENDEFEDDGDPATALSRKRAREEKEAEDKKNRGNYRCSKCNLPKKGHVCPYQPRFRRRDQQVEGVSSDVSVQVEIDPEMTVRMLSLDQQGLPESYMTPLMTPHYIQQHALMMATEQQLFEQSKSLQSNLSTDHITGDTFGKGGQLDSTVELSQQRSSGHTQSDFSDSSAFAVHNSSFQATRNLYPMNSTFDANPVSFTTSSGFGPDASFLGSTSFGTDHIDFNISQPFESKLDNGDSL